MGEAAPDDLSRLSSLEEDNVRAALRSRFEADKIYTNINALLVAINPYQMLPLYGQEVLEAYNQYGQKSPGPHVFSVAAATYRGLLDARSQSVIISGESGAGKTETAKRFLQFLAYAATQVSVRAHCFRSLLAGLRMHCAVKGRQGVRRTLAATPSPLPLIHADWLYGRPSLPTLSAHHPHRTPPSPYTTHTVHHPHRTSPSAYTTLSVHHPHRTPPSPPSPPPLPPMPISIFVAHALRMHATPTLSPPHTAGSDFY